MKVFQRELQSPIGLIRLKGSKSALHSIELAPGYSDFSGVSCDLLEEAAEQLLGYFSGNRTRFEIPLEPYGTLFQKRVWRELRKVPFGTTLSYGEVARKVQKPTASRAVGAANHANPIPIMIPCHRIVGSSGKLTGFAAGLPMKKWLLDHEQFFQGGLIPLQNLNIHENTLGPESFS